ncbi:MAG TPA: histidine kinase N-terminal 7TM domain-containing protein, partial [Bacteroidota bacterium]|nr:histidine kinase N-terminal 7TM domain-containing protein [Bacteroidota bacterium]
MTVRARRGAFPGEKSFTIFMLSAAFWAFTGALEWFVALPDEKAFWSQISYFGIVNVAPAFFCFVLAYSGYARLLTKRNVILLWLIPAITLLLALTNKWHGLNWPSYAMVQHPLGNYMYYEHGPSFWMFVGYSYLLNIASSILLLRQSGKLFRLYQTQSMMLLAAMLFPWIGNMLYNSRTIVIIDLTPAAFTFTGVLIWWNMKQYHLFNIAPVARETLFNSIKELVIVVDEECRIVDMNMFAQSHFHFTTIPIGKSANDVFSPWDQLCSFILSDRNEVEIEFHGEEAEPQWFLATKTPLVNAHANPAGTLIICRNITERKRVALEREELIVELQEALANVKTLNGLLPICATCKKIRNDEGYWQQVDRYVAEH